MILREKSDCSPDWTELLSILADLAKLTEKCSKNCGLLPKLKIFFYLVHVCGNMFLTNLGLKLCFIRSQTYLYFNVLIFYLFA